MGNKQIINEDVKNIIEGTKDLWPLFAGKNILITGASGMLASYLVESFINANKTINKNSPSQLYLVIRNGNQVFGKNKNIHYLTFDISKQKPDTKIPYHFIVHAASKAAPKLYMQNMIDTLQTNILGLTNLLESATKETQSFLFFSSSEVYGSPTLEKPIKETDFNLIDHLSERACYSMGKKCGETLCMAYFREKKIPVKIARIFHTFGPGLNLMDGRVFSDFIRNGIEEKPIEILGDKDALRPLLYIKDATIMFIKLLASSKNGEAYNIANEDGVVSVYDFAMSVKNGVKEVSGKEIPVKVNQSNVNYYKGAVKAVRPSIEKFVKDFSWKPKITIKEAVTRTLSYYLS
jgi:UDP-glucuronate decarboxylase